MELRDYQRPPDGESTHQVLLYVGMLILWMLILTVVPADAEVLVSEREIHDAVEAFALEQVSGFAGDLEVSVRWRGDLRIPGVGAVRTEIQRSTARGNARLIPVTVQVFRGPAVVKEVPVTAEVRYFDDVLVAARRISRGESFEGDAMEIERRDVTRLLGKYVSDPSALDGMRSRMQIGFGRPILDRYAEPVPVVSRGDRVRIRVHVGSVTATTTGVAKGAGAVGESIVVMISENRQKLLVRVAAPGVVDLVY